MVVRNTGQAVLSPSVGARAGLVVGEVIPGIAAFTIVFADGPPLALAQVRSPFFPLCLLLTRLVESYLLSGHETPRCASSETLNECSECPSAGSCALWLSAA